MTPAVFDFPAIKARLDQINGLAPSGDRYIRGFAEPEETYHPHIRVACVLPAPCLCPDCARRQRESLSMTKEQRVAAKAFQAGLSAPKHPWVLSSEIAIAQNLLRDRNLREYEKRCAQILNGVPLPADPFKTNPVSWSEPSSTLEWTETGLWPITFMAKE